MRNQIFSLTACRFILSFLTAALALSLTIPAQSQTIDTGFIFKPLSICTLVNTAAVDDKFTDGETRTYTIRGESTNLAGYGGSASGCGLPGFTTGVLEIQNRVAAIAVNIKTLGVEGRGSIKVWPADELDSPLPIDNYEDTVPPLKFNNFAIIPLCGEVGVDPCTSGDINVQINGAPAHVKLEVTGYFMEMAQNLVRVASPGGDFTSIGEAVDAITDASPDNPYVIEVSPGTFMEDGPIVLKPGISVVGSGAESTLITSASDVVVMGSDDSRLASLTIFKEDGADVVGIQNIGESPTLENLNIEVSGGSSSNIAIHNDGSSPVLKDVSAIALGADSTAMLNEASSAPVIRDSKLEGFVEAIANHTDCETTLINTQISGDLDGGGFTCINSFNGLFSLLNNFCLSFPL
ncbi:MAG: hypothetical protein SX243_15900 [Acidobacteriota bacterium]|nr:hypothetical protein [Acidobacteriota bacterium]